MNILWLINIPLPEASELLNEQPLPFGGWLINASMAVAENDNINLSVAFPQDRTKKVKVLKGKKINYYIFTPISNKRDISNRKNLQFEEILEKVKPDIVHVFGTEYAHSLVMIDICKEKNIKLVINIQGMISVYSKHYMASIPERIQKRFTFRDFIKQDNLKQQQKKFVARGKLEIEAIKKVENVIGRTNWDKACTTQIKSNIKYHFCNETLRDEFYKHTWDINKCEKFSIFVSQGQYPIKGLHFMIEAMTLILKRFPKVKLYIAGHDITKTDTLKEKIKISSYAKYIKELIDKYNLHDKVIFTGLLNEEEMCDRYLKSNVFICPSSIENSPNSLGEAMILGVPCVAADVGGVSDMIEHKKEGFVYQPDAYYMIAYYVEEIFKNKNIALNFSKNARKHALITHNRKENLKVLLNIYEKIINEGE